MDEITFLTVELETGLEQKAVHRYRVELSTGFVFHVRPNGTGMQWRPEQCAACLDNLVGYNLFYPAPAGTVCRHCEANGYEEPRVALTVLEESLTEDNLLECLEFFGDPLTALVLAEPLYHAVLPLKELSPHPPKPGRWADRKHRRAFARTLSAYRGRVIV